MMTNLFGNTFVNNTEPQSTPLLQGVPKLVVVMGVSGSGKSTVALQLALALNFTFLDADDFHSPEAKQSMSQNIALTDEMRLPWISSICYALARYRQNNESIVLAFSGLKAKYRAPFRTLDFAASFILLNGSEKLISKRLQARKNHFANEKLLTSQINTLELPLKSELDIVILDISLSVDRLVSTISKII